MILLNGHSFLFCCYDHIGSYSVLRTIMRRTFITYICVANYQVLKDR